MSRTPRLSTLLILAAAGLPGASLITPTSGHAQSISSRAALLNHNTAAIPAITRSVYGSTPRMEDLTRSFNGELALLGRARAGSMPVLEPSHTDASARVDVVDSERALLGRWAVFTRRPLSALEPQ